MIKTLIGAIAATLVLLSSFDIQPAFAAIRQTNPQASNHQGFTISRSDLQGSNSKTVYEQLRKDSRLQFTPSGDLLVTGFTKKAKLFLNSNEAPAQLNPLALEIEHIEKIECHPDSLDNSPIVNIVSRKNTGKFDQMGCLKKCTASDVSTQDCNYICKGKQ